MIEILELEGVMGLKDLPPNVENMVRGTGSILWLEDLRECEGE